MLKTSGQQAPDTVTIQFEGRSLTVPAGRSVAAALLEAGETDFRTTPVSGSPRGPYCMMGVCFDCLMEIDGRANQQACLTPAVDGMVIQRQHGPANLKPGGAADE